MQSSIDLTPQRLTQKRLLRNFFALFGFNLVYFETVHHSAFVIVKTMLRPVVSPTDATWLSNHLGLVNRNGFAGDPTTSGNFRRDS
jgi:hypothetical protein